MVELSIYGLIALVIFLLIKLQLAKKEKYADGYWDGYEDGYLNMSIVCEMQKVKEEQNDETIKTEQ
jgi:hypothetical protein